MTKILIILLVFIFGGCAFLINPKETFVVKNTTDKDIKISFFSKSVLIDSIKIEAKNKYEKTLSVDRESIVSPFDKNTDSLIIQFSDKKYLRYYCQGVIFYGNSDKCFYEKNLLDFASGERSENKTSGKVIKTLTFDESDYQKAIPL